MREPLFVPETKPIGHVAECPAQQQPEGDRQIRVAPRPGVVRHDEPDDDDRDEPEDRRVVAKEPEQSAVVLAVDETERVAHDRHRRPGRKRRRDPRLGELVDHDDEDRQAEEDRPDRTVVHAGPPGKRRIAS